MASFDIIHIVGKAYKTTWAERRYLLPMLMLPFVIKLGCYTVLASFDDNKSLWWSGIILLPAFFFEGWLLSHWVRTIMTGGVHRWPFRISGNEAKDRVEIQSRGRGIMGGTVAYVLLNFLMSGYYAFLLPYIPTDMDPQHPDPNVAMVGVVMIITTLLLFRFLWLFIPLSMNLSLNHAIEKLKPMNLTFKMIGVWMICVIPAFVTLQLFSELILSASPDAGSNAFSNTAVLVFRIVIDMVKNLIVTAGMAFVFLSILLPNKK